jgi:hypothetical protein
MKTKKKKLKTIKHILDSGKKITSGGKNLTSGGKNLTSDGKKITSDGKNRSRKRFNRRFTQRAGTINIEHAAHSNISYRPKAFDVARGAATYAAYAPSTLADGGSGELAAISMGFAVLPLSIAVSAGLVGLGQKAYRWVKTNGSFDKGKIRAEIKTQINNYEGDDKATYEQLTDEDKKNYIDDNVTKVIAYYKANKKTIKATKKQERQDTKATQRQDTKATQRQDTKAKPALSGLADEPKQKSSGRIVTTAKHGIHSIKKGYVETREATKQSLGEGVSNIRRKSASFIKEGSNYMKKLRGEEVDSCSLVKDKLSAELDGDRHEEIARKTENHPFFKDEDAYFKSLVKRNMNQFCFKTRVGNDAEYYSRFCRSVLTCMKTPKLLPQLLFEAIDAKATKRMFDELPGKYNPSDIEQSWKTFRPLMNLKVNIVNRITKENTDISEEKNAKQRFAMILSVLQNENKKTLSTFIVDVLIKTIIDYKKAAKNAPSSYKGDIHMQLYVDRLIKRLTESNSEPNEPNEPNEQSGGSGSGIGGAKTLMTLEELEKVGVEELYEGMMRCTTKDLIKAEHKDSIENSGLFEDGDIQVDGLSESLESPKLLYIVIGSLALVSLIELGIFDAPECLSHTFL